MNKITELKQKRAAIVATMREINERAEDGLLTAEDRGAYDRAKSDFDAMSDSIKRQEDLEATERAIADAAGTTPEAGAKGNAFRDFLRTGYIGAEMRALSADTASEGGYTVPDDFRAEVIKGINNLCHIRGLATVINVAGASDLGIPTMTADIEDATWQTEIAAVNEDTALAFGKRLLKPTILAKLIKVSQKLLRNPAINAESFVAERMAYKFAVAMESGYLTGNGTNAPLGLFTASADGINTDRDISTGNTTTAIGADNLFALKYGIAAQYRANASWLFHRDAVAAISKLQDGAGNYLWTPGLIAGQPDRLLGAPIAESEYVPNTFTAGLYVGLYGDFKQYWIADSLNFEIQRLVELYAATNQVGFIGRASSDGQPVLPAAFARMKLAAS